MRKAGHFIVTLVVGFLTLATLTTVLKSSTAPSLISKLFALPTNLFRSTLGG
jgi:hypothetical protein